jgi:hypothetical protein
MVTYPHMPFHRYTCLASTYRPSELGRTEIEILSIFAHSKSQSVYSVFKELKRQAEFLKMERFSAYKDVHKRVKRLVHLKLIDQIPEHFERGAKYYKITPYGLITYLAKTYRGHRGYIVYNTENIVIQSLLFECLEEETIDSFSSLKGFPTREIQSYLHDCCSTTADICKEFWTSIQRYNITDILPDDDTIQKYMFYLDSKPVDQNTLDEIKKYEKRLTAKLNDKESDNKLLVHAVHNYDLTHFSPDGIRIYKRYKSVRPQLRNYLEEKPPFPLLEIFYFTVQNLTEILEDKKKLLVSNIVSILGNIVTSFKVKNQDELEKLSESSENYALLPHLLRDKRFIEIARALKEEFDIGYKQFLYYQ